MAELTDEDFASNVVGALMTIISEKDKNMREEFDRFWEDEFYTHEYQFDR